MKNYIFLIFLPAIVLAESVSKISPMEVEGLLRNDFAVLVDVRESEEVQAGVAARARWLPLSKINAEDPDWTKFAASVPKGKQVVFYCRSGKRANTAGEKFLKLRPDLKVSNMGGFSDWVKAGLPTRKTDLK